MTLNLYNKPLSQTNVIETSVRQGYVMLLWLFNVFIECVLREQKMKAVERCPNLVKEGELWLYADDAVLVAKK